MDNCFSYGWFPISINLLTILRFIADRITVTMEWSALFFLANKSIKKSFTGSVNFLSWAFTTLLKYCKAVPGSSKSLYILLPPGHRYHRYFWLRNNHEMLYQKHCYSLNCRHLQQNIGRRLSINLMSKNPQRFLPMARVDCKHYLNRFSIVIEKFRIFL